MGGVKKKNKDTAAEKLWRSGRQKAHLMTRTTNRKTFERAGEIFESIN